MINILNVLIKKKYDVPLNIPLKHEHKYVEVISNDWAKYIEAITMCGNYCMLRQFTELIDVMNKDKQYTKGTLAIYTTKITKRLVELGFIGTEYLNNYKYIYIKKPALAFQEGNYINHRKINRKEELKTDKFLNSITKLDYLIKYGKYYPYSNISEQLLDITRKAFNIIKANKNNYNYDVETIEKIIELKTYEKISLYLNNKPEYKHRLGIIRTVWTEIGKEFWKLSRQGYSIADTPVYLNLYSTENGETTLHYTPEIVIFDTSRDLEYYRNLSNSLFHLFVNIDNNSTLNMQKNFIETKTLGYKHFNRIGYTCLLIGTNKEQLEAKIEILNKQYGGSNEYHPLVEPCKYVKLDTDNYFQQASISTKRVKSIERVEKKIDEILNRKMNKDTAKDVKKNKIKKEKQDGKVTEEDITKYL